VVCEGRFLFVRVSPRLAGKTGALWEPSTCSSHTYVRAGNGFIVNREMFETSLLFLF
jgi:hypothetical protein